MTYPQSIYDAVALVATIVILLLILCVLVLVGRLLSQPEVEPSSLELGRRLQRVWKAPILKDPALAQRIVDITTAPILKENYRTTLSLTSDLLATAASRQRGRAAVSFEIKIETSFRFVNVTSQDLTLRITQPVDTLTEVTRKAAFLDVTVAGVPISVLDSQDDKRFSYEIVVPANDSTAVTLCSDLRGELPLILELPQTTVVASGAKVRVISALQGRIGLLVVGSSECSFCEDYYEKAAPFDRVITTTRPLLPGESMMLFVGMGRSMSRGVTLRNS